MKGLLDNGNLYNALCISHIPWLFFQEIFITHTRTICLLLFTPLHKGKYTTTCED